MKVSEGKLGRVFVLRLEDGDKVPDCIERFAADKGVAVGHVILLGGIGSGQIVSGPRDSVTLPPEILLVPLDGVHEVAGVGVIAPTEDGKPVLHIHGALGRAGSTRTGCLRPGVTVWGLCEAIIYEITGTESVRVKDAKTGFSVLEP